jgi:RHS repeat-associated protein
MFTGREYFPELGIYDYRNRFYYPTLGRFLQSDPTGFAGGDANLFRYCGGDPINRKDPDGATVVPAAGSDRGAINTAINYLSGSSTFAGIFSTLQSSPQTYTISTNYSALNGYFYYGNGVITWNPGLGSLVASGEGIQSPALILAHELAHAFHYDTDPEGYFNSRDILVPGYQKLVEYVAITWETLIARELGEAARTDHYGNFVRVSSPTDTFPELKSYLDSRSTAFVRYYLSGMLQFPPGWGTGSGLNPGSFGGASTAAVESTIFQTLAGIPGGGGLPGEGFHPVGAELE